MTEKSAYNCSQLTAHSSQPRSVSLDCAKGTAILLVLIGHELQIRYSTEILSFRLIYSFHMPFFMFLAGMVFSLKFRDFLSQKLNISLEITKSVRGLLIPFICWTIISAFLRHRDSMLSYFWAVVKSPDSSLWFLLVLFWCRIFFVMIHALFVKLIRNPSMIFLASFMAVIFAVIIGASRLLLPGNFLGVSIFAAHFPYFAAGVFVYQYRERLSGFLDSIPVNIMMIVVFAVLAPFWYLTIPNPAEMRLAEIFRHGEIIYRVIKELMPIPGIFLMMSLSRLILLSGFRTLITVLCLAGKMTLGIYAFHLYFMGGIFTPVIVPLSVSMILTWITDKIPFVRSILLGK